MTTLFNSFKRTKLLIVFLLTGLTLVAYEPVRRYEFVDYDDDRYVTANPRIQQGLTWKNTAWALQSTEVANWHPLTWLSHMADCELYGLNPSGHHLTNLFFHLVNVILLLIVLHEMTGAVWRSALVAALFALHPLNVESVAWIAERKNVLSTLFWLLTMWAYAFYARQPGWKRYLLVATLFVMGLMSKPMLVTLPCVLLLLDYWPLGRFVRRTGEDRFDPQSPDEMDQHSRQVNLRLADVRRTLFRLVVEKLPLLLLAAASSAITIKAQQIDGALNAKMLPLSARLANALVSYASYIYKMIWPVRLAVLYPHPGESLSASQVIMASLILASITVLVIWGNKKFPYLTVGWLWYLGTLVPVIGLVQVGSQSMADRYAYVPLIGLFIIIAWGTTDLARSLPFGKYLLAIVCAAVLIALTVSTRHQLSYWQDSIALFTRALEVTDNNDIAHNNLGAILVRKGRFDEGLEHLYTAVKLNPAYGTAYINIAVTLYQQASALALEDESRWPEAVDLYRRALEIKPDFTEARQGLDSLLGKIEKKK